MWRAVVRHCPVFGSHLPSEPAKAAHTIQLQATPAVRATGSGRLQRVLDISLREREPDSQGNSLVQIDESCSAFYSLPARHNKCPPGLTRGRTLAEASGHRRLWTPVWYIVPQPRPWCSFSGAPRLLLSFQTAPAGEIVIAVLPVFNVGGA